MHSFNISAYYIATTVWVRPGAAIDKLNKEIIKAVTSENTTMIVLAAGINNLTKKSSQCRYYPCRISVPHDSATTGTGSKPTTTSDLDMDMITMPSANIVDNMNKSTSTIEKDDDTSNNVDMPMVTEDHYQFPEYCYAQPAQACLQYVFIDIDNVLLNYKLLHNLGK